MKSVYKYTIVLILAYIAGVFVLATSNPWDNFIIMGLAGGLAGYWSSDDKPNK